LVLVVELEAAQTLLVRAAAEIKAQARQIAALPVASAVQAIQQF
jgi:hypothetical protein